MQIRTKRVTWNIALILIIGCLMIGAIEGVGFREIILQQTGNPGSSTYYYSINIINLTKLATINDYYNHLGINNPPEAKSLVLSHDTYALLVAGISILFISALIPLLTFTNKSITNDKSIIHRGRIISALGWLLVLIGAIVFLAKTMSIRNELVISPYRDYQSFSKVFDTGSIAGLFILIGIAGLAFLMPWTSKNWAITKEI